MLQGYKFYSLISDNFVFWNSLGLKLEVNPNFPVQLLLETDFYNDKISAFWSEFLPGFITNQTGPKLKTYFGFKFFTLIQARIGPGIEKRDSPAISSYLHLYDSVRFLIIHGIHWIHCMFLYVKMIYIFANS